MAPQEPPDGVGKNVEAGRQRKTTVLRLDPAVHDALAAWARDELRSTNAQIEMILRRALVSAGRLPDAVRPVRGPGRPRKTPAGGQH